MIKTDSTASQSIITYGITYHLNTKHSITTRKQNPANLAALLGREATLHILPGLTLPATSLELPHILCIHSLLVSPVVLFVIAGTLSDLQDRREHSSLDPSFWSFVAVHRHVYASSSSGLPPQGPTFATCFPSPIPPFSLSRSCAATQPISTLSYSIIALP